MYCYAAVLFVCPSARLSRMGPNSKTKQRRKIKIGVDVSQGTSKWTANFEMKRSKVKITGRQKPPQQSGVMFTFGQLMEHPLLQRRLHDGRGLEFPSVTPPVATTRTAA